MSGQAEERRRSERLRLRARAWCEAKNHTLYGRVGNVSATGLVLLSAAPLSPGDKVTVAIAVDQRELVADAEVVWARDAALAEQLDSAADRGASGLALRFLQLSAECREILNVLLAQGQRRTA